MNYDKTKYKVWTWKNPMMLHWIINPGLAFNELALGQRIPKVMLIEKNSNKRLGEKSFVPCPHCETLHTGLKWTPQNKTAFRNWFGYYCDNCGGIIPCLTNLTSCIILVLTFPVWFWFKNKLKAKWLEAQKVKFSKPLNLSYPESKKQWWLAGLIWGFFMYVSMSIIYPFISKGCVTKIELLIGIPTWTIGGLVFGYTIYAINKRKK